MVSLGCPKALVDSEENRAAVVALREIAAGFVKPDYPVKDQEGEPEES